MVAKCLYRLYSSMHRLVLKYTRVLGKQFPKLAWGMTGIFTNIRFRVLEVKTWEQIQKNTASSSRAVQHLSMPCNLR